MSLQTQFPGGETLDCERRADCATPRRENIPSRLGAPSLESLRAEEERLQREITHRKGFLFAGDMQRAGDIGSLAVRLSDVKKAIAGQTLCLMATA